MTNSYTAPLYIAWVNSQHFMAPPVVYSLSEVWETSTEIAYWWHVMLHHYPDLSSVSDWLKMCLNQSAALLGLLLQDQVTDTKIKDLHLILG